METKTRTKKGIWGKVILILLLVALLVAIGLSITYIYQLLNVDTFYEGVIVDGIPLGGKTLEESKDIIKEHNQPELDRMKIILTYEDKKWEYTYKDIDANINIDEIVDEAYLVGRQGTIVNRLKEVYHIMDEPKTFETELTYDVSLLKEDVHGIKDEINIEPVDATIEFIPDSKDKFAFTPETVGRGMLADKTMEEIIERVHAGDFSPYEILTEELHPKYTLDEVKTWTSRLGYYSTKLTNNGARNHNIKLSSGAYYNVRLEPGEVFSFNEATGPRGAKQGYRAAPVIKEGKRFEDEPGGGNCQSSTTLYGAVMRADLDVVERAPHSIKSTYTPIGTDATVNYPYADFKFKNNKDTPIFITRYISGGQLHVEIYGKPAEDYDTIQVVSSITSQTGVPDYKIVKDSTMYEGEEKIEYQSRAGIKAVSYKIFYKDGKEVRREKAANSSYPKVTGQKRVGTKKKAEEPPKDESKKEPEEVPPKKIEKPKKESEEEPNKPEVDPKKEPKAGLEE